MNDKIIGLAKNRRGAGKISMVLAVAILLPFCLLLIFAFFSSEGPFSFIFARKKFNYTTSLKQATVYYSGRDWDKAKPILEKLITEKPDDYLPHYMIADIYARQGYPREAEEHFKTVLRLKPEFHQASASLASLYLRMGIDRAEKMDPGKASEYFTLGEKNIAEAIQKAPDEKTREDYRGLQKQLIAENNKLTQ